MTSRKSCKKKRWLRKNNKNKPGKKPVWRLRKDLQLEWPGQAQITPLDHSRAERAVTNQGILWSTARIYSDWETTERPTSGWERKAFWRKSRSRTRRTRRRASRQVSVLTLDSMRAWSIDYLLHFHRALPISGSNVVSRTTQDSSRISRRSDVFLYCMLSCSCWYQGDRLCCQGRIDWMGISRSSQDMRCIKSLRPLSIGWI